MYRRLLRGRWRVDGAHRASSLCKKKIRVIRMHTRLNVNDILNDFLKTLVTNWK